MQSLTALMEWVQATPLAVFIHKNAWAFTTIEVVHVFAISLVIGTIAIVDLRLLGLASTKRPFAELARQVLPLTWIAFVLAATAGSLLFIRRHRLPGEHHVSDQDGGHRARRDQHADFRVHYGSRRAEMGP